MKYISSSFVSFNGKHPEHSVVKLIVEQTKQEQSVKITSFLNGICSNKHGKK